MLSDANIIISKHHNLCNLLNFVTYTLLTKHHLGQENDVKSNLYVRTIQFANKKISKRVTIAINYAITKVKSTK